MKGRKKRKEGKRKVKNLWEVFANFRFVFFSLFSRGYDVTSQPARWVGEAPALGKLGRVGRVDRADRICFP